jgi:ring-1,2-phenylacetyl-CoA epoxidase subunit PaaA
VTVLSTAARGERADGKYELHDDMPAAYRAAAARIASSQCLAELVGVLPFAEWITRAPDLTRRQMLLAKVQDEVGHGHVMARVAEDLGVDREQILHEFVVGERKLLNIFHFGFETWEEVGPAALLLNSAAIVQFQSLHKGSYLPYCRALRKIEKEESFHYHHAHDLTHEIMFSGDAGGRRLVQEAFENWFPRVLAYFGPPDVGTFHDNWMHKFGLKVDSNDTLRARWVRKILPVFALVGVRIDPELAVVDDAGDWIASPLDWDEARKIIEQGGPRRQDWAEAISGSLKRNSQFRAAALTTRLGP